MINQKPTDTTEARQGDLDDLPGTYTLDDGHAGSYDHEATVSVGDGATVTVTCSCGEWTQTGEARFGDEGDTAVLAAWEVHVYKATGRGWREDGRVDIDAVRAGTPDLADAPAIYESLCDEVEQLRAIVARFQERHYPYPSADSPHAYCLSCVTGRKEVGSNFPEYHPWPCPDGVALEGGVSE
jgi:hypothetical protein